jgi:serine/threonine protein kinase
VTEEHLKSLASYQILGQVATGSAAIVYKAHDPEQGRFLALKRLIAPSAEQRALGYEEVRTLAKVSDPHVVSVYEFFEEGEDAYVAEEWIDGATVARLIADGAPFSPIQAVAVMRDALSVQAGRFWQRRREWWPNALDPRQLRQPGSVGGANDKRRQ